MNKLVIYGLLFVLFMLFIIWIGSGWGGGEASKPGVNNTGNYYFYIYGTSSCPHCMSMKKFLIEHYGSDHVFFCEVYSSECGSKFNKLMEKGVPGYVPAVFIVYNYTVSALIIGEYEDVDGINGLLKTNNESRIPIYMTGSNGLKLYGYINLSSSHLVFINEYLYCDTVCKEMLNNSSININTSNGGSIGKVVNTYKPSFIDVLPALFILGLLDSVNPCTLTLYFSFLVTCLAGKKLYGPPTVFILIIYLGYFMLGLGIFTLTQLVPPQIFIVLAMIMGLYNIFHSGRERFSLKCTWCEKLGFINKVMGNKYLLAVILAGLSVFVLLPCTAGPLVVFTTIIRDYPLGIVLFSLILYNILFISPLLILFVSIVFLGREKRIAEWLKKHIGVLEFLSGVALLLISFILLLTL